MRWKWVRFMGILTEIRALLWCSLFTQSRAFNLKFNSLWLSETKRCWLLPLDWFFFHLFRWFSEIPQQHQPVSSGKRLHEPVSTGVDRSDFNHLTTPIGDRCNSTMFWLFIRRSRLSVDAQEKCILEQTACESCVKWREINMMKHQRMMFGHIGRVSKMVRWRKKIITEPSYTPRRSHFVLYCLLKTSQILKIQLKLHASSAISWMNDLRDWQINLHNSYTSQLSK